MSKLHVILVAAAAAFAFGSQPAQAVTVDSTFTFTGDCEVDCAGTANATLVLSNYTLGTGIGSQNFVSLTYHSNILSFSLTAADAPNFIDSVINSPLPGAESIIIFLGADQFSTFTNGSWCAGNRCVADNGNNGMWAETPLPAALPLFATGLGGLGLLGWRRKRKGDKTGVIA